MLAVKKSHFPAFRGLPSLKYVSAYFRDLELTILMRMVRSLVPTRKGC
jgi:hypothetical protein